MNRKHKTKNVRVNVFLPSNLVSATSRKAKINRSRIIEYVLLRYLNEDKIPKLDGNTCYLVFDGKCVPLFKINGGKK